MRRLTILVALSAAIAVSAAEAKPPSKPPSAPKPAVTKPQAPKGGAPTVKASAPKGPSVKAQAPKGPSVKAQAPKGPSMKASAPKGAGVKASAPKNSNVKATGSAKTTSAKSGVAKTAKADAPAKSAKVSTTDTTSSSKKRSVSSGTTTTSSGTVDFTATKAGSLLEKNSNQRAKLEGKLLAAGYTGTVYEAAYGFKNFGQFNAAMNQVQNHGYSFDLLKVLMTGTYVDPQTHQVYRAQQMSDGTVKFVSPELATNPVSTKSLGQAKQAIAGGAVLPTLPTGTTTTATPK